MPTAFVLLNTEIGAQTDVLKNLRKIEGVQEAFNILGSYDVIARVKADTTDKLTKIIMEKLPVKRIHSKLTIIVSEKHP